MESLLTPIQEWPIPILHLPNNSEWMVQDWAHNPSQISQSQRDLILISLELLQMRHAFYWGAENWAVSLKLLANIFPPRKAEAVWEWSHTNESSAKRLSSDGIIWILRSNQSLLSYQRRLMFFDTSVIWTTCYDHSLLTKWILHKQLPSIHPSYVMYYHSTNNSNCYADHNLQK